MNTLVVLSLFIATIWTVVYQRLTLLSASAIVVGVLVAISWIGTSGWLLALLWIVTLGVLIPLNVPTLRQGLISAKALKLFKKVLPALSQTEQEALDAGTVWWDGDLFSGKPDWDNYNK